MDVDDSFYDELSSFMPSPNEYDLNASDLDEIIGSTVSHLDSSLDLNTFIPPPPPPVQQQDDYVFPDLYQPTAHSSPDFDFNFGTFSAFTSPSSVSSMSSAERTPSTSSAEGPDCFDDLMNFLNEDDIKIEELTRDNLLEHTQARNTPSPTGSCSSSSGSSSGSSTSGVHSDISDTSSSRSSATQSKLRDQIDLESATFNTQLLRQGGNEAASASFELKHEDGSRTVQLPLLTQPLQNVQLVPLQTVPGASSVASVAPIKVEAKLATKTLPQVKLLSSAPAASKATPAAATATASNGKPKTIFLSSNDFKALMQKMNSGGGVKSAKINGSVSAQMPKIIMKTSNGKVVTANRMQLQSGSPLLLKHQQTSQPTKLMTSNRAAINGAARMQATTSGSSDAPPISVYRSGMVDEKMYKKQQRMIKNRESASLSRKKKKEYVTSLESRINRLEQENYTLKGDNVSLRNQLVAFAKTCKCRNGNVSEFVLNSLNAAARDQQHVKIAPKPAPKSLKQRLTAATVKKNVAVLFAMAFMVTLNAGNFQSYLNKQNLDGDGAVLESIVEEPMSTGRRLLWVDTEEEYNEKLNRSKRQAAELEVPPLHFLRPANRSGNATQSGPGNEPPPLAAVIAPPKCNGTCAGAGANQTEYSRLARNLHKWIDGNDYLNLSMHTKFGNELDNPHGFKLTTDYLELKSGIERQTAHPGKRKIYLDYATATDDGHKQRRMDTQVRGKDKPATATATMQDDKDDNDSGAHSLKLYKPNSIDEEYLRLFKGIKRQDDTFYVLSFNMEHILLPASAYNKSVRPKMSLLLPTGDPTRNGDIVLMQIDCEVFNTTQLELKSHMIPAKLRPNVTKWQPAQPHDVANNSNNNNNETQSGAGGSVKPRDKLPLKYEPPKEKPRVRTYFMMGPKNQAAAAASQEKPRLVSSGELPTAGNLNVRNATLYARMRETEQGEFGP